jgi:hypothetical protein
LALITEHAIIKIMYLLNILGNPKLLASPIGEEGHFGETYPKVLKGYKIVVEKEVQRDARYP